MTTQKKKINFSKSLATRYHYVTDSWLTRCKQSIVCDFRERWCLESHSCWLECRCNGSVQAAILDHEVGIIC